MKGTVLEGRAPLIAALVALVAAVATMTSDPIGGFNDDGIYLLTAKALATGQGYVYPQLPGTPAAIHYPPLWPMILAAAWKVAPPFPENIGWFKFINPVLLSLAAYAGVHFGRSRLGLPSWVALGGVLVATLSVPVLLLTNLLLSEPLFLALLLPTLLVAERLVREGGVRLAVGAAALVAILMMVRTLGGVVLVAAVMLLARERRWRELLVFAGVTVVLLMPWQRFVWAAAPGFPDELRGSYGPYLEWVVDGYRDGGWPFFGAVLAKNVRATWEMLGIFFLPGIGGAPRHLMAFLATLGLASGMVVAARRAKAPVTALALAGYIGVTIAWPFWVDRFLWVIWPILILVGLAGAVAAVAVLRERGHPRAVTAVLLATALVGAGHAGYNARGLAKGWESSASQGMTGVGSWLVRQVNSDRRLDGLVIAAEMAPMVALYTGEMVVPLEIMAPRDHVVDKGLAGHVDELVRIDRRFRPGAYVVLAAGPFYAALQAASFDAGRTLLDVTPPGAPVRTFLVETR